MHTHTAAAGRQQVGLALQRDVGHPLKEVAHIGMLHQALVVVVHLAPVVVGGVLALAVALLHVEHLGGAGNEQGQAVAALGLGGGAAVVIVVVAVVIFQQANVAHFIQQLLEMRLVLFLDLVQLPQLGDGVVVTHLHGQGNVGHLVGEDGCQTPVFGVIGGQAFNFLNNPVCNLRDELHQLRIRILVTLVFRDVLF